LAKKFEKVAGQRLKGIRFVRSGEKARGEIIDLRRGKANGQGLGGANRHR